MESNSRNDMVLIDESNMAKFFRQTREYIFIDSVSVVPAIEAWGHGETKRNDWYYKYHFPNNPVMPGVFQMEAIQQTAGVIINTIYGKNDNRVYFLSAENVTIKQSIKPDCEYSTYAKVLEKRHGIWKFQGKLEMEGKICCHMVFSLVDADEISKFAMGERRT